MEEKTCSPVYRSIFHNSQDKEPLKCLSSEERTKQMWYIYHTHTHTMEYSPAMRKKEILSSAIATMDVEAIVLIEISDREREMPPEVSYM